MIVFLPKEIFVGLVFAIGTTLIGYTWTREIPDVFCPFLSSASEFYVQ